VARARQLGRRSPRVEHITLVARELVDNAATYGSILESIAGIVTAPAAPSRTRYQRRLVRAWRGHRDLKSGASPDVAGGRRRGTPRGRRDDRVHQSAALESSDGRRTRLALRAGAERGGGCDEDVHRDIARLGALAATTARGPRSERAFPCEVSPRRSRKPSRGEGAGVSRGATGRARRSSFSVRGIYTGRARDSAQGQRVARVLGRAYCERLDFAHGPRTLLRPRRRCCSSAHVGRPRGKRARSPRTARRTRPARV